ncbi:hypothetical protein ACOME3_005123 [Neoechinorhynchus agilis]
MLTMYNPWLSFRPSKRLFYRIRPLMVARCTIELLLSLAFNTIMIADWLMPIIYNHFHIYSKSNYLRLIPLIFQVCLFGAMSHITLFFLCFQPMLNLMAELSGELNREFYYDWWNCTDLTSYWNKWNQPVHRFLKYNVYVPSAHIFKFKKFTCETIVFVVSGLMHDLAFLVCCNQLPFVFIPAFGTNPIQSRVVDEFSKHYPNACTLIGRFTIGLTASVGFVGYSLYFVKDY